MRTMEEPAPQVDEVLRRVDEVESRLQALVPEEGRRGRMLREAAAPAARRQPLGGAVVGVKDVIHVTGLLTRAGSAVPPEALAGPQASSVTLLREAGAIVLGKTVTAEFASAAPGPTRNPRSFAHTPGGSSSGSAAAVGAGYCPFALGTQTVGSVIRPAAYCGVVGFKPSYGRIPVDGVVMNAPAFDTVGVLAADVHWALVAASVLCGGWSPGAPAPGRPVLGVPEGPYLGQAGAEAQAAFARQVESLEAAGYAVLRVPALLDIEEVNRRHVVINRVQFAEQHAGRFDRFGDRYRPATARSVLAGRSLSRDEYARALEAHPRLRQELSAAMGQWGIDLWICPAATGPAPEGIETTGDPRMNLPWTHAGLPVVTVPAGQAANGLPLGLQVVAGFGADERLLAWAGGIERAMQAGEDMTEPGA